MFSRTKLNRDQAINYLLLLIYVVLLSITKTFHEPWRDEFHALSIASTADSPMSLYALKQYEGHPYLYYFMIYLTQWFGHHFILFSGLHFLAALGVFYLILFISKWPLWIKILLPVNYFLLFEFGVINRSYVFMLLFLWLGIFQFQKDNKRWLAFFWIGLSAHMHLQIIPITLALTLAFIFKDSTSLIPSMKRNALGLTLYILLLVSAFLTSLTPPDRYQDLNTYYPTLQHFKQIINASSFGLTSLFDSQAIHWWNKPLIETTWKNATILFGFLGLSFYSIQKSVRWFYVVGIIGTAVFLYLLNAWGIRHMCFLWLLYLSFVLLHPGKHSALTYEILFIMFLVQGISGSIAVLKDYQTVFSHTYQTGRFLKQLQAKVPVAGYLSYTLDGLCYQSNQPIYYLGTGSVERFTSFRKNVDSGIKNQIEFQNSLLAYLKKYGEGYLVIHEQSEPILNHETWLLNNASSKGELIYQNPSQSVVWDENFRVYKIKLTEK